MVIRGSWLLTQTSKLERDCPPEDHGKCHEAKAGVYTFHATKSCQQSAHGLKFDANAGQNNLTKKNM